MYICQIILNVTPTSDMVSKDSITWKVGSDGNFALKTAYCILAKLGDTPSISLFCLIWK